ncbi:hypothetical protein [Streptococcus equinus]|uniref:hypothetical protein n=1 Tax=Streptococcus equinus TaxID=1335 RepID=UPI000887C219|nr:hypothetical protein [Streptococcus equinus]SDQ14141.1 hypothetical protein SAMN05216407_0422 [Streptococcus equinus]
MEEKDNRLIGVVTVKDFFTEEEKEVMTSYANQDKVNLEFVDGPEVINDLFKSFVELLFRQDIIFAIGTSVAYDILKYLLFQIIAKIKERKLKQDTIKITTIVNGTKITIECNSNTTEEGFKSAFEELIKIEATNNALKVDQLIIKECQKNHFEVLTLSEYISELQKNKK